MTAEYTHQEQAARYAAFLQERFEQKGILQELAGYPNFVVWRYRDIEGQRKKPPFNPRTHQPASPTERTTWGSVDSALHAVATGKFHGIGFMLSHSPFGGIDLDHSVAEGKLLPWAQAIVETMETYGEYSPSFRRASGTGGIHLLFEGKPAKSRKQGNIEVYGEKRYLTVTTHHLPATPTTINQRQAQLDSLSASLVPAPLPLPEMQNTSGGGMSLTDLPLEAQGDLLLQHLLRGDMTGYPSQSSADFVLIMKLLHWTGDDIALTRDLFLASPLGQREKAERRTGSTTYVDMTIANVLKKRRNPPMRR